MATSGSSGAAKSSKAAKTTRRSSVKYNVEQIKSDITKINEFICRAGVDRKWQLRNVQWTLDWTKEDSVVRNFLRNWLQSRVPEVICQRLDWCKKRGK